MPETIVFIVAAVVINVLVYGGITAVYFADNHRVDPPRIPVATGQTPAQITPSVPDHEPRRAA